MREAGTRGTVRWRRSRPRPRPDRSTRRLSPFLGLAAALFASSPAAVLAQPIAAAVREAVIAGEPRRALAAIDALDPASRGEARIAYLEARLAARLGDFERASRRYAEAVGGLPPAVLGDARRRLAEALLATGRAADAEARLLEITPSTRRVRALLAQAALASGEHARAEPLLATAIAEEGDDTDGFALRMARAEALVALGRVSEAEAVLRELLVSRPEHPDDASARLALEALGGARAVLTFDEALARAERLSARFARAQALEELRALGEPEDRAARARYRHVLGMVEYAARHDAAAEPILLGAVEDGAETAIDDAYHAARAGLRAHVDAPHVAALRGWAEAHPRDERAVEAQYLAAIAEASYDAGASARALRAFLRRTSRGDYAREARFRLGLAALDARDWREADDLFAGTSADADVDLDRLRARYWRARVSEARGRRGDAIEAYRALVTDAPLGWYALLARARLLALGEAEPPPLPEPAVDEVWSPSRVTLSAEAAFYDALGLLPDAARALRRDEAAARADAGLRALVQEYARLGDFERAYRLTNSEAGLRRPPTGGAGWAWRAAFPLAFEGAVRESARAAGLAPALVWAVMRQESAFDPVVVSVSDAIGLMQMLPATGERTAARLGVPFAREDLFRPEANVRLGAAYLGALVEELGAPLAFAAYNAGEHRVRAWLEGRECEDLDRFVDTIPFEQTRNYTRRVTGNLARYAVLEAAASDGSAATRWPALDLTEPAGGARCTR